MTAPDLWPTKDEVTQIVAHGRGMWKTCCGCHESNEGHPTGPIHPALQCVVGSGCHECGGIGAVWDTTDYADMADFLMREEAPATPAAMTPEVRALVDAAEELDDAIGAPGKNCGAARLRMSKALAALRAGGDG